jgi:hypothetical protein
MTTGHSSRELEEQHRPDRATTTPPTHDHRTDAPRIAGDYHLHDHNHRRRPGAERPGHIAAASTPRTCSTNTPPPLAKPSTTTNTLRWCHPLPSSPTDPQGVASPPLGLPHRRRPALTTVVNAAATLRTSPRGRGLQAPPSAPTAREMPDPPTLTSPRPTWP